MNTYRFARICPALVLLLLGVLALGRPATRAEDASPMITQAKNFLQDERYLDALASAKDAVRADPENYQAHFYVGMAHLALEQFDAAAEAAGKALALAPEAGKPGVTKLVETIKTRRQGAGTAQQAAAALADGMAAKAARLYEQAWNAAQDNPELGLKAADLYAHQLGQPLAAARVLRQVQRVASGDALASAEAVLKEISAPLHQSAVDEVAAANAASDPAEQQSHLQKAEEADPDYAEIYTLRAQFAALGDSVEALQAAITGLARHKLATPKLLAKLPNFARWLDNLAFKEFLSDIIGAPQVDRLQASTPKGGWLPDDRPQVIADLHLKLVLIPEGSFAMGSVKYDDEKPVHTVTISKNYWLGETKVTQAQWSAVMGSNPSDEKGSNLPVENLSWDDCQEFCRKLTERERTAGRLPEGYAYRLPTEAEWEYACRAGTTGDYAGDLDAMAWYEDNTKDHTTGIANKRHSVREKRPNAWGLYDMHGSMCEWCADWYAGYPDRNIADPKGPASGTQRVRRGGCLFSTAAQCRSAYRDSAAPNEISGVTGFRLALSIAQ